MSTERTGEAITALRMELQAMHSEMQYLRKEVRFLRLELDVGKDKSQPMWANLYRRRNGTIEANRSHPALIAGSMSKTRGRSRMAVSLHHERLSLRTTM